MEATGRTAADIFAPAAVGCGHPSPRPRIERPGHGCRPSVHGAWACANCANWPALIPSRPAS